MSVAPETTMATREQPELAVTKRELRSSIGLIGMPSSGKTALHCATNLTTQVPEHWILGAGHHDAAGYVGDLGGARKARRAWEATDPKKPHRMIRLFEARRRSRRDPSQPVGRPYPVVIPDMPGELYRYLASEQDAPEEVRPRVDALLKDLTGCSGLICLVDPTVAADSVSSQVQALSAILGKIIAQRRHSMPMPISIAFTKVDLLMRDERRDRVRLRLQDSLRAKYLADHPDVGGKLEVSGEYVTYGLAEAEVMPCADPAHHQAVVWDYLNARLPAVAGALYRLAEDPRLKVGVFMISNWGGDLPIDAATNTEIVPTASDIRPRRVLDPIVFVLDIVHDAWSRRRLRRVACAAAALWGLLLVACPLAPRLGGWLAQAAMVAGEPKMAATVLRLTERSPVFSWEREADPDGLAAGRDVWFELASRALPTHTKQPTEQFIHAANRYTAWGGSSDLVRDILFQGADPWQTIQRLQNQLGSIEPEGSTLSRLEQLIRTCQEQLAKDANQRKDRLQQLDDFGFKLRQVFADATLDPDERRRVESLSDAMKLTTKAFRAFDESGSTDRAKTYEAVVSARHAILRGAYPSLAGSLTTLARTLEAEAKADIDKAVEAVIKARHRRTLTRGVEEVNRVVTTFKAYLDSAVEQLGEHHRSNIDWFRAQLTKPAVDASTINSRLDLHAALPPINRNGLIRPEVEADTLRTLLMLRTLESDVAAGAELKAQESLKARIDRAVEEHVPKWISGSVHATIQRIKERAIEQMMNGIREPGKARAWVSALEPLCAGHVGTAGGRDHFDAQLDCLRLHLALEACHAKADARLDDTVSQLWQTLRGDLNRPEVATSIGTLGRFVAGKSPSLCVQWAKALAQVKNQEQFRTMHEPVRTQLIAHSPALLDYIKWLCSQDNPAREVDIGSLWKELTEAALKECCEILVAHGVPGAADGLRHVGERLRRILATKGVLQEEARNHAKHLCYVLKKGSQAHKELEGVGEAVEQHILKVNPVWREHEAAGDPGQPSFAFVESSGSRKAFYIGATEFSLEQYRSLVEARRKTGKKPLERPSAWRHFTVKGGSGPAEEQNVVIKRPWDHVMDPDCGIYGFTALQAAAVAEAAGARLPTLQEWEAVEGMIDLREQAKNSKFDSQPTLAALKEIGDVTKIGSTEVIGVAAGLAEWVVSSDSGDAAVRGYVPAGKRWDEDAKNRTEGWQLISAGIRLALDPVPAGLREYLEGKGHEK